MRVINGGVDEALTNLQGRCVVAGSASAESPAATVGSIKIPLRPSITTNIDHRRNGQSRDSEFAMVVASCSVTPLSPRRSTVTP